MYLTDLETYKKLLNEIYQNNGSITDNELIEYLFDRFMFVADFEGIELLIKCKVDPSKLVLDERYGPTLLFYLPRRPFKKEIIISIIELLLKNGVDPTITDGEGRRFYNEPYNRFKYVYKWTSENVNEVKLILDAEKYNL